MVHAMALAAAVSAFHNKQTIYEKRPSYNLWLHRLCPSLGHLLLQTTGIWGYEGSEYLQRHSSVESGQNAMVWKIRLIAPRTTSYNHHGPINRTPHLRVRARLYGLRRYWYTMAGRQMEGRPTCAMCHLGILYQTFIVFYSNKPSNISYFLFQYTTST